MDRMRLAKTVGGLVVVAVLFGVMLNWIGDYRAATSAPRVKPASAAQPSSDASKTAEDGDSAQDAPEDEQVSPETEAEPVVIGALVVTVDGLNFREQAKASSEAMRGLGEGERVEILAKEGSWYKVRDSKGVIGYITSNPSYTDDSK